MTPLDQTHWPLLESENPREFLEHLGTSPLAEHRIDDHVAWVVTRVADNLHNGVARTHLSSEETNRLIIQLQHRYATQQIPFLWHVTPDCRPEDLGLRLEASGFRCQEQGMGMAVDLHTVDFEQPLPKGLQIQRTTDRETLAKWFDVHVYFEGEPDPQCEALYADLGLSTNRPLRHFLASFYDRPVAICSIFLGSKTVGLYNVLTHPRYRRLGFGTAVVLSALCAARNAGYRLAVLQPTPDSRPMYERIGFRSHQSVDKTYALVWET